MIRSRAQRGAAHRAMLALSVMLIACDARSDDADVAPSANAEAAQGAAAVSVVDDAGRTVRLERPATRVISMIPAQTEIVTILAGVDAVIARTVWDTDPRLAHLPALGNALTPSIEWLAAQRPDLVIAWPDAQSRDVVHRLESIGIPTYASRVESVTEIRAMIERLGVLLGREERADSLLRAIDAQLDSVRGAVRDVSRQRVLYLLAVEPPTVAGPGTFVDDLITIAGGENIFSDLRQLWPQVSLEEIVRRQPDVIIRSSDRVYEDAAGPLRERSGWRSLRAVQHDRVRVVSADLYNRAGATVGVAARGLAQHIHGDSLFARR